MEEADAFLASYGPRVQLLYAACQELAIAVPGVEEFPRSFTLLDGSEMLQSYVVDLLPDDAGLQRSVLVAIYRFNETRLNNMAARRNHALGIVRPGVREKLRQLLFFMGRYFEDFQRDPVLKCIFPPPPKVVESSGSWSEGGNRARLELSRKEASQLHRATAWLRWIAPRLKQVQIVLELVENPTAINLKDLLSAEGRTARLVALGAGGQPATVAALRAGLAAYRELEEAIAASAEGGSALERLPELIARVDKLAAYCRANPVLRDLFPPAGEPPLE